MFYSGRPANGSKRVIVGGGAGAAVSSIISVVTVSKCFLSVGFGRFCRKKTSVFGLGFHDKCVVNFFMTRVIWRDFHHH